MPSPSSRNVSPCWIEQSQLFSPDGTLQQFWLRRRQPSQPIRSAERYLRCAISNMSSDTIRVNPRQFRLLVDFGPLICRPRRCSGGSTGSTAVFFLYECSAKRRVILPPEQSAPRAECRDEPSNLFFGSDSRIVQSSTEFFGTPQGCSEFYGSTMYRGSATPRGC